MEIRRLCCLVMLAGPGLLPAQAPTGHVEGRTAREQKAALDALDAPMAVAPTLLDRVEQSLRRAKPGHSRPGGHALSWDELRRLQADLAQHHHRQLSLQQVQALADAGEALLRAAPNRSLESMPLADWGSLSSVNAEKGVVLWLLNDSFPGTSDELRSVADGRSAAAETWLLVGKSSSAILVVGATMAQSSVELASSLSPALATGPHIVALSHLAGYVGLGALATYEGFSVWHWRTGYLTDRQFYRRQAYFLGSVVVGTGGALAGAKAGAVTGGAIGAFFGPAGVPVGASVGTAIGLVGGGLLGGAVGSGLADLGMCRYYECKDREQQAEYIRFLRNHYGLK